MVNDKSNCSEQQTLGMDLGNLGVVVIGRNEGLRLSNTLGVLVSIGSPVIYVDSRSTDNSVMIAESLDVEVLELLGVKPVNASRARNDGANVLLARFPNLRYLQFMDGDTELDAGWLATAIRHLDEHPEVGFVCGQLREKDRDENIYRRLCDMEWRWESTDNAEPCRLGGMGLMRVSAFVKSGGYDESLIAGADPELYSRLVQDGWKLHVLSELMGVHDSGMVSFRQWWTRNVKSGFGFADGQNTGTWGRERRSTLLWGGFLPLIALIATIFLTGWALVLLFLLPLNAIRIWFSPVKREFANVDRWLYAFSCMVMKIPQFVGIVKYHWRSQSRQTASVIQYK